MNRTIGILGGMGPMASCDLMRKIIENTDASCDQEHVRICVDSNTNIPDRTAAILGEGEDPRPEMIKSALHLQNMGADVIIIACNTAHYFLPDVEKCVDVPILNMPEEVAKALCAKGIQAAAVLATDGTIRTGLYDKALNKFGIMPIHPRPQEQEMLMTIIYDYVKAGREYPYPENIRDMEEYLLSQGAECMILACTELPIAFADADTMLATVDATEILAQAAIQYTGNRVKAELCTI